MTHAQVTDIQTQLSQYQAEVAIVLGSGLGQVTQAIQAEHQFSYQELPSLNTCSVLGHSGQLVLGNYHNTKVACFQGRFHWYEPTTTPETYQNMMAIIQGLGCKKLIITNAAGSLREEVPVGSVVAITDHLNLQGKTPVLDFVGMEEAYDPQWLEDMQKIAKDCLGHQLPTGIYGGVHGPQFETPAEIRMLRTLGADLVGMSTVPEVIAARACGIKVLALSVVTNLAAGLSQTKLSHEVTLKGAQQGQDQLIRLIDGLFSRTC